MESTEENRISEMEVALPFSPERRLAVLLERKRRARSPLSSPKLTLPAQKRMRTGTEGHTGATTRLASTITPGVARDHKRIENSSELSLADFLPKENEKETFRELQKQIHTYMLLRYSVHQRMEDKVVPGLQDFLATVRATHTHKVNIRYHSVLNAIADSKDTVMTVISELYEQYVVKNKLTHVIVEGDAKLYAVLQSLKCEYKQDLEWLVPFPGDWHTLMNFQHALMKPYFDTGLKHLAIAAGYPPQQIKTCSQFKRTHSFILEVWEAVYRSMITIYTESRHSQTDKINLQDELIKLLSTKECEHERQRLNKQTISLCETQQEDFAKFVQQMAKTDDTWKFWANFVFMDVMAYVSFFLAMRSGDWTLRLYSLKQMVPVFTAFDHLTYQKLISDHLADVQQLPESIRAMFNQGAHVVSLTGRPFHSVGIDEAHEVKINRDCKSSITNPNPDRINRMTKYITYRSTMLQNLKKQLFPIKETPRSEQYTYTNNKTHFKIEQNIRTQVVSILSSSLLELVNHNQGLQNVFAQQTASEEQHRDLLNFRTVGQEEYLLRVLSYILRVPSVKAPNRRKKLQTLSERKCTSSKINQMEKDRRLLLTSIKKKIQHSLATGTLIEQPSEQLSELPLALCDHDGNLFKGQKSYTTSTLETMYKEATVPITTTYLPENWKPECTIIEGMFLINTTPLGMHKTFGDYAKFLLQRHIKPQV